jgi:hypothetical protein
MPCQHRTALNSGPHAEPSGCEVYRYRQSENIPIQWGAMVGDCVHNLRSAFDLLAHDLVRKGGGVPDDNTAFPVSKKETNETKFRKEHVTKKLKGASETAKQLVINLKPWKGGNAALWKLHLIDIADKHLLLIPVAAAHRDFGVRHDIHDTRREVYPPFNSGWLMGLAPDRKFPLGDGDELTRYRRMTTPDFEDKTEFHFGFEVAFGEGQIFDGAPVIPTLTQLADLTQHYIGMFAREIFGLASW